MIVDYSNTLPTEIILFPDWTFPDAQPVQPEETITITGGSATPGISIGGSADQGNN